LTALVINSDGECSTVAASLGRFEGQADCLGPKVVGRSALVLLLPNEFSQWQFIATVTAP